MLSESEEVLGEPAFKQTYNHHKVYKNAMAEYEKNVTESEINLMVNQVLSSNITSDSDGIRLENLNTSLSDWQLSQLERVRDSESGIRCLLNSWLVTQKDLLEGEFEFAFT